MSAAGLGWAPRLSTEVRIAVDTFELVSSAAGAYATPADVVFERAIPASAPGTVARALADAGLLDLERPPALDAQDHWYRARLARPTAASVLVCEGLATLTEIWLDGALRARSDSMYVTQTIALPEGGAELELVLCFRALTPELSRRRPRPRWRTRLVEAQGLRFVRTSLLGRMPGLGPVLPAVGPYRPIYVSTAEPLRVVSHAIQPCAATGRVEVTVLLEAHDRPLPNAAELVVEGAAGGARAALTIAAHERGFTLTGAATVSDRKSWWPHTHGEQPLSAVSIRLAGGIDIPLGTVGFRKLAVDRGADGAGFRLIINDVPVFARGACLTTTDFLSLGTEALRETLTLAQRAGMNMIRIPGIACYAPDALHALCDELGLMVFQDLMLANMDYPAGDPTFDAALTSEVRELLSRIGARPSTVVVSGGSEVLQQAAMLGLGEAARESPLYEQTLPALMRAHAPDVVYVPNSPSGGALPFHVDAGIGHYYGVGAYLRPLEDVRRSSVRFAAECLAFANVPQADVVEMLMGDLGLAMHHPRWKARVPRDRGASWDFDDVRDHYIARFFQVDVQTLRAHDPERYLALGHAAVGEAISATFAEWRAHGSSCGGGLVFWLRDHFVGAGFGLIDATGLPKSAYYFAARSFAPLYVGLTDEGLNGLAAHICNDSGVDYAAELHVCLFRDGDVVVEARHPFALSARSGVPLRVDGLLPRFADASYAYRFGPPAHDLVVATLLIGGQRVHSAFYLPQGLARSREADLGLQGTLMACDGGAQLTVQTRSFAQSVCVDVPGYLPDDDYFHLAPGECRTIRLRARTSRPGALRGRLSALNARAPSLLVRASDNPEVAS